MKRIKITKDSRLPEGYASWTQIAKMIPDQDQINKIYKVGKVPLHWTADFLGEEMFVSDTETLKVRAFDEINLAMPSLEEMEQIYHQAFERQAHYQNNPTAVMLSDFVTKMARIFYPERFR